ncbi:MAG: hypothetical protein ACYCSW_10440 [bacterium]
MLICFSFGIKPSLSQTTAKKSGKTTTQKHLRALFRGLAIKNPLLF